MKYANIQEPVRWEETVEMPARGPNKTKITRGLWDWQAKDVKRLKKEGKRDLARLWDDYYTILTNPRKVKAAAELAAKHKEPHWELFYRHWQAQDGLWRNPRPLDAVLLEAARAKALADRPEAKVWAHRFCAHESLWEAQLQVDAPGCASEIADKARVLAEEIPENLDCCSCIEALRATALLRAGRLKEADKLCNRLSDKYCGNDNAWYLCMTCWGAVAEAAGDARAMAVVVDKLTGFVSRGLKINEENKPGLRAMGVRLKALVGDLDGAVEAAKKAAVPEGTSAYVDMVLALAKAFALARRWKDCRVWAEKAALNASRRRMTRDAAESLLLLAEAHAKLGEERRRKSRAKELSGLIGRLGTRDLDKRAKAVGAEW